MALPVVSLALKTLQDLLLEETKYLYGVSIQVKVLESQFKEMLCLLQDADKKQHESNSVRNWIKEIRDLSYKAEDVIETYAIKVSSRRGFTNLIKRFSCIFKECVTLHQIGWEISDIKSEIERIHKSMQEYGIRNIIQGETSSSNQQWRRLTYPFENIDENCFVGMDEDLRRLVSLVVDDEGLHHRVIGVWGMGGKGKTAIARKVYNQVEIRSYFQSFAWVCITQQCSIRSVMEDVLQQLNSTKREEITSMSDRELIEKLIQVQKDKSCMIVLDDIWEIDHWDGLSHAFLVSGLKNTKVLLTTRKKNVADVGYEYELGLLNVRDGWELLKMKAFAQDNVSVEENSLFQAIGEDMVQKCGCLPLGISVIGGILRKRKSLQEWKSVNENINLYLYRSEDDNKINGVLDLSYEDLPYYLKPCFMYMGRFPEDEFIDVDDLYRLWISEGMINSHENQCVREKSLMDVAELYLGELVSRCIVQVVQEDEPNQYFKYCQLHDIVRELCLSKGIKEDFRLKVMDYGGENNLNISGVKTRYLAVRFNREPKVNLPDAHKLTSSLQNEINSQIRSLKFDGEFFPKMSGFEYPCNILDFHQLKLLRMLVLKSCRFKGRKLPRGIGNLVQLRYLHLWDCELDELPSSIRKLINLYTLDLRGLWDVRIPNVLDKMLRLKHLFLPFYRKDKIGNYRLRLEGLDELETLWGFNSLVHDWVSVLKMKNLREFSATIHDNRMLSEIIDCINTNWSNLLKSTLFIERGCELTSTGEGLAILKKLFTCSNLHHLFVIVPMRNLLVEYGGARTIFPCLVTLHLENCELEEDPMEILEKLPTLKRLTLRRRSYVGEVMSCHAMGFPKLKYLQLCGLPNLKEWRVESGAMAKLCKLEIDSCEKLEIVPERFRSITTA